MTARIGYLAIFRLPRDRAPFKCRAMRSMLCGLIAIAMPTLCSAQESSSLGLPSIPVPHDNPQNADKIALGRALFFDTRLSRDQTVSCATCHDPGHAFTDGKVIAEGIGGAKGTRNTPSLVMAAFGRFQFLDGRRHSLEDQAMEPLSNPAEHGLNGSADALALVRADHQYRTQFLRAFNVTPDDIAIEHLRKALSSFERSLPMGGSPFDRYYYGGEKQALSDQAQRGLQLFTGRARCSTCHLIDPDAATFTDHSFHTLGVGMSRIQPKLGELVRDTAVMTPEELDSRVLTDPLIAELGRYLVTRNPSDIGKFKTPSLRNVEATGPYMHDGSVTSLEQAVDIELYYRGLTTNRPLILTPQEKTDLVAFLRSLTSPQFAIPTPVVTDLPKPERDRDVRVTLKNNRLREMGVFQ